MLFLLQWLPGSILYIIIHTAIVLGVLGLLVASFLKLVPFINIYRIWIQLICVILLAGGIYWKGAYEIEMNWRARVAELESKVAAAEAKSVQANKRIQTKIVEKTRVVREKGRTQIEYVNRVVKGDTVEIVKNMSEDERQKFLIKQKELQDALKNCPVPRIIIEEHNRAAESK